MIFVSIYPSHDLRAAQFVRLRPPARPGRRFDDGQLPVFFSAPHPPAGASGKFFTANIRNMRRAYFVAVAQFSKWCEQKKLRLEDIQPIHVAAYIEQ